MSNLFKAVVILLFSPIAAAGQIPNLAWAGGWGGIPANEWGSAIAVDASGAVYTTGCFNGTVDFDPGPATHYLSSIGNGDVYVSKLDASGNLIWVKTFGGPGWDIGFAMKLDPAGNIYVAGTFASTADFDPGPGVQNLTSPNSSHDAFLLKFTPLGQFAWVKHVARGNSDETVFSMALDTQHGIYLSGSFGGTPDFDPGPGTSYFSSAGGTDVFVTKYDWSGALQWVRGWGDAVNDAADEIALDGAGNVYTTGYFAGTVDFDPGVAVYSLTAGTGTSFNTDVFVSKLDTLGNFRWARRLGGNTHDEGAALTVSGAKVIVGGFFTGTADFDPGSGATLLTAAGNHDVFLTTLDTAGSFIWARAFGGGKTDHCVSLATDAAENVFVTGWFTGNVDLDPGTGSTMVTTSNLEWDMYLSKFDAQGNFVWGVNGGSGPGATEPDFLLITALGELYVTGAFTGTADFDPWTGTVQLTTVANPSSNYDIFLAKYNTICAPVNTTVTINGSTLSISPTAGAAYQWLSCDNGNLPVAGQTNLTFTPTITGNYAVAINNQGCIDTSACTHVVACAPLNTTVSANSGTLTVTPTAGATYQWLDCNIGGTPIPGQIANVFTPTSSGLYSVEVRTSICIDTSVCVQVTTSSVPSAPLLQHSLQVFPNAFSDVINATWPTRLTQAQVSLLNPIGRILQTEMVFNATAAQLNTANIPPGTYLFCVTSGSVTVMRIAVKLGQR